MISAPKAQHNFVVAAGPEPSLLSLESGGLEMHTQWR